MNTGEPKSGLIVTVASLLAFTPFGLSLGTIFMATGFTMLGAFARVGFEISSEIDKPEGIRWSRIFALLGASLISAATISVLVLVAMKLFNIPSETILVFMLICFGYFGPTGFPWLISQIAIPITKLTGIKFPNLASAQTPPTDGGTK